MNADQNIGRMTTDFPASTVYTTVRSRVAAIQLTEGPPLVLLADHVEGDRPILVYRVADLGAALVELAAHGWDPTVSTGLIEERPGHFVRRELER